MRSSEKVAIPYLLFVFALFWNGSQNSLLAQIAVSMTQTISPATISVGASSIVTFEITNNTGTPLPEVSFNNTLPAGLEFVANSGSSSCQGSVSISGELLQFSGRRLGAGSSCLVEATISALVAGSYVNTSDAVMANGQSGSSSSASLTVEADRPSFTKGFAPSSVNFGGRSTLTFVIDNSQGANGFISLAFRDVLPAGMTIADPPNILNTCAIGTVSAVSGGDVISLTSGSSGEQIIAGQICSYSVDVLGQSIGELMNISDELTSLSLADFQVKSSGEATASLTVFNPGDLLVTKEFVDDPYEPGGAGELRFEIKNLNRSFNMTDISFSDDLNALLTGLVATGGTQSNVCGTGSSLTDGSNVQLTGAHLSPGASCSFSVVLSVPSGSAQGEFTNTTGAVSAMINGTQFTGTPASDKLFITSSPSLSMNFSPTVVTGGQTTQLTYNLVNPSAFTASDISFTSPIGAAVSGSTLQLVASSNTCSEEPIVSLDFSSNFMVSLSGAQLAPDSSCSFVVDVVVPLNTGEGDYEATSSAVTCIIEEEAIVGRATSAFFSVLKGPSLKKSFASSSATPGDTIDVTFTIGLSSEASLAASNISFTDDLNNFITGAVAVNLPAVSCGGSMSGTDVLSFTGGSLNPGESCDITVPFVVPASTTSKYSILTQKKA